LPTQCGGPFFLSFCDDGRRLRALENSVLRRMREPTGQEENYIKRKCGGRGKYFRKDEKCRRKFSCNTGRKDIVWKNSHGYEDNVKIVLKRSGMEVCT
jgi:hypothetical protein